MNDISFETGVWNRPNLNGHVFDEPLCAAIVKILTKHNVKNLYDLGCGHGNYTRIIRNSGFDCLGYDGNPYTNQITLGLCHVMDLSKEANLEPRDCALTLEVGEHIPKKYEDVFISNVNKASSDLVILSWAVPGQGGEGHFNEQPNEYVRKIFTDLGYVSLPEDENFLRENSTYPWFKNTIMVFKKAK